MRKYWLIGGGIGLLLACGIGLRACVEGYGTTVNDAVKTAVKAPAKNDLETSKAVDNQSITPSKPDINAVSSKPNPNAVSSTSKSKPTQSDKAASKNGTNFKESPNTVNVEPKKQINTPDSDPPPASKPEVELTIILNSDLSEKKIMVNGKAAKLISGGLNMKKILVTTDTNHTIVIEGCEKIIHIQKANKTINFSSCH